MTAILLGWLAGHWLLVAALVVGIAAIAQPVLVWKFKAWILLAVVLWWGWTGHAAFESEREANTPLRTELATANDRIEGFRGLLKQVNKEADKQIDDAKAQAEASVKAAAQAEAEAARLAERLTTTQQALQDAKADPTCAEQLRIKLCARIPLL